MCLNQQADHVKALNELTSFDSNLNISKKRSLQHDDDALNEEHLHRINVHTKDWGIQRDENETLNEKTDLPVSVNTDEVSQTINQDEFSHKELDTKYEILR